MRRDQVQQEPAYVLHRIAYKDSSQIVELFTREHGRVGAVARGARRPKSPWRGLLQPFGELLVSWSGRSELRTLTGVEPAGEVLTLAGERLFSGFYLNELILRLLQRHDAHVQLYDEYRRAVTSLAHDRHQAWTLRLFERSILDETGYGLNLSCDARSGQLLDPSARYEYHLEEGPVLSEAEEGSRMLLRGSSLLALARAADCPDPAALKELRILLRTVIDGLLGDRPLKTRQVLSAMKQ